MSKKYDCELCGKHFDQKCDYEKHKSKKSPCVSIEKIGEILKKKDEVTDNKTSLTNLFKSCLDILRDGHDLLTGDKALRNLAYLLDLKLLESQIGKEIDFDSYDKYDFSDMDDSVVEHNKKRLLHCVKFSNLAKEKEDNIPNMMSNLWKYILSQHPKTKNIFVKNKSFDISHQSTYKKLIKKLDEFDFENIGSDILGDAYGSVVAENMKGETLGQFFTPHKVTKMMVELTDPKIKKDGKIETMFDPAMGTGGFLISSIRHMQEQSKLQKIKLDWEFIANGGICGREADQDTYQLAISNMLISSGHMFNKLEKGDSIRNPITNKYDIVLANPPFGIKGLEYSEIEDKMRDEYMPIKINSAVPLFLQAIIHMLNINGRCAVVLPDGQELFSKNNALSSVREYLMKTCDLKEIIYMPAGIFTHTSIKTCVFYFIKKKDGKDILKIDVKKSKTTGKESKRDYKFSKTHQTSRVKFYDYNPETNAKYQLIEVDIKDLEENNYSLNYTEYIKDEKEDEKYDDIIFEKLDNICEINFGTRIVKSKNTDGDYPVYGSGRDMFTTSSFNREGYNLLIGRFALSEQCVRLVNQKLYLNDSGLSIKPKKDTLLHQYLGYYIYLNQNIVYKCARGTAQKNLDMDKFKKIKIPIPSLEKQKEIVEYLDFIYEKCNKSSEEKIKELNKLNKYCLENQKKYGENEIKTLKDVCTVKQGTYITKEMKIKGDYPVYGGGDASFYINNFNRENEIIIAKDGVSKECVRFEENKFFLNHHGWTLECTKNVSKKYTFYYLKSIQDILLKIAKGTAQLGINQDNFYKQKFHIPSLEKQKEIVEYCEYNEQLIKQLEKEIEKNKKIAESFINDVIKNVKQNDALEESSNTDDSESDESKSENSSDSSDSEQEEKISKKRQKK
jgi:type I restriction enzyme S subunit